MADRPEGVPTSRHRGGKRRAFRRPFNKEHVMQPILLFAALLVLSFVSIFVGVIRLTPADLLQLTPFQVQLLLISRLPRLLSILISGSALAVAGTIMQQLARNRFVSPTTAGTMDSARLGVLVSLLLFPGAGLLQKMVVALLFALAGTFAFVTMLRRIQYKDVIFVPLVGLMLANIIGAGTTFIAYRFDLLQSLAVWMYGDFSMILAGRYELLYLSVPLMAVAYGYAQRFTVAGMGEDFATNLGLNYRQVVNLGLVLVAAISAIVVLTVGSLPFLGLIVPNIVSIFRGDDLRKNLTPVALLGALIVLVCDVLGRVVIFPYEIPVGLMMGVLGSGAFLYLLMRRHAHGS